MVSKEPFIKKEMSYTNGKGEMKLSTITEIEKKCVTYEKNRRH